MKRPNGVIAIAVVAILGSLGVLAMATLMAFSFLMIQANPAMSSQSLIGPANLQTIMLVEVVVFFAFGVFGIVAAIGLLRLKNWARTAFLVFSGILVGGSVGAVAMMIFMGMSDNAFPGMPPEARGMLPAVLVIIVFFEILLAGLALWWLIYLTRQPIRVVFLGEDAAAQPRRGPLSVTILGWMMLIGGVPLLLSSFFSFPILVLGILLEGWPAHIATAIVGLVCILAGAGIVRWRAQAYPLALGFTVLGALNGLSMALVPGARAHYLDVVLRTMPDTPGVDKSFQLSTMTPLMTLGFAVAAVQLYILIAKRRAFLDACNR